MGQYGRPPLATAGILVYRLFNRYLSNVMNLSANMSTICTDTCLEMLFTFQQDSALAHHTRETIELLQHETPNFILPGPTYGHPTAPT